MKELNLDKKIGLALLFAISIFVVWYFIDAYSAESSVENLIFIGPVAILTLGLCLAQLIRFFKYDEDGEAQKDSIRDVVPTMIVFSGYILSLGFLGFDLGTILFIGIFLRVNGEKNWKWILIYSISFGILIPYFFSWMLPYPMPMTFLPTDY